MTEAWNAINALRGIEEIKIARLRPGDVIIVKTATNLEPEENAVIRREVERLFPGHEVVITIGLDIEVVRPESLVRYEEGPLDWGDSDPCAHRGDPCEKCAKPFPLRGELS
jgi:hypothetical protein